MPITMEDEKIIEMKCHMNKTTYSLVWRIEGFNMMPFIREHPVFGPNIRLGPNEDSTWQLMLCKERGEDDKLPSIGCKLVKTEENNVWDICRYDITIGNEKGDIKLRVVKNALAGGEEDLPYIYVKGAKEEVYKNEDGVEQPGEDSPFKSRKGVVQQFVDAETDRKLNALFNEPTLVIECDIRYTYVVNDAEAPDEPQEKLLVEDLMQLYKSQKFSDLVLRSDNHEFKVHRSILCARAPGFRKYVPDDNAKPVKQLELEATEVATKEMLNFIYSGEYPEKMSVEDNLNLYTASCKYGLKALADYCLKVLRGLSAKEPFEGSDDVKAKIQEILKEADKESKAEVVKVFTS